MKTCYPWFGGKSRVASTIWSALGPVSNYVEPFAGSLAVALANPNTPKVETVNDVDCFIPNFWRAISADPEAVAEFADFPVIEADLHAKQRWLLQQATPEFITQIEADPHFYNAQMAGYWVWGLCASVGNNWLQTKGLKALPGLSTSNGIHARKANILTWFKALQARTRKMRITCGDWKRVCSPTVSYANGAVGKFGYTGVFLDPPYSKENRSAVYRKEQDIFGEVLDWAVSNAHQPKLRIVLCGYEGNHKIPDDWFTLSWKTQGGYANRGSGEGQGMENAGKERIWLSPQCIFPGQTEMSLDNDVTPPGDTD
jgi:DNA adenine methylase